MPAGVYIRTEEIKKCMSEAHKSKHHSKETKRKIGDSNKKPKSEKAKVNMKGHCGVYVRTEECKRGLRKSHKGHSGVYKRSEEMKYNISKGRIKWWTKMNKEERLKYMIHAIKASQKANPSSIEKKIWKELNKLKVEYEVQVFFNCGKFIVDIYIPEQKLIIECNGNFWHNLPGAREKDKKRKEWAENNGYRFAELWEGDINKNSKQVLKEVLEKNKI